MDRAYSALFGLMSQSEILSFFVYNPIQMSRCLLEILKFHIPPSRVDPDIDVQKSWKIDQDGFVHKKVNPSFLVFENTEIHRYK